MKLAVEGIEATQATQFYRSFRHLDVATAEHDNAVPLVAGKPLAVRVYPDLRRPPTWIDNLTVDGELWFRPAGAAEWQQAARFPGSVLGQPSESIDREDAEQTLNFRIPAQFAAGLLTVRTRVWVDLPRSDRRCSDWLERRLAFVETHPLRLRLYGVHLRGVGFEIAPPTAAEAIDTLTFLRKTFPVSRIEVVSYETIDFAGDLGNGPGTECGKGWSELLLLLSRLRTASVSALPHYALLPFGVPNNGAGGFGSPLGIGASFVGAGSAMAQELGHVLQRRHAPGGGAQDADPCYPAYGDYPSGSIGEYGFDPATGQVFSPASSYDFMGYCGNYWVSPHTYRALLDIFRRPSVSDATPPADDAQAAGVYLHLGLTVRGDHRVDLVSGLTLPGPPIESDGDATSYRLELWDQEDHVLSARTIRRRGGHTEPGAELHLLESIPFAAAARRLAFLCCARRDPVVFEIPRSELKVALVAPASGPPGQTWEGIVDLRWEVTCENPEGLVFFLRYSCDGGMTWQPVNLGFEWRSCQVDLDLLPGGEDCRFQVIASTILQTATAETVSLRVRRKPRRAMIAGCRTMRCAGEGFALQLTGTAHAPDGLAEESELTWSSSLQGPLGTGSYLTVHNLAAGAHEITLTAPDGLGGQTRDRTVVRVALPDRPSEEDR